jgi:aminobenzoyl-glutamate utilization protein A
VAKPLGSIDMRPGVVLRFPDRAVIDEIRAAAAKLEPWLVALRREFHMLPELGWREFETTRRISAELTAMGYEVISGDAFLGGVARLGLGTPPVPHEGETGCIARFDTGKPGPHLCLRVDIDALPIQEAAKDHRPAAENWASQVPGVMHACGHDGHVAVGLGVARLLRQFLGSLCGTLSILFQPAEEGGRGARSVVDAGHLEGVDALLAVHIGLGVPSGTVALGVGGFLATRKYAVRISGTPAHAGKSPEHGRNALLVACQMALGLHTLAQSSVPGTRVNVGTLHAGSSLNIVPDQAVIEFEIRCGEEPDLETLDRRCKFMISHMAGAHGVVAEVSLRGMAGSWENPRRLVNWAASVNDAVLAFPHTTTDYKFGASEDATLLASAVVASGGVAGIFVLGSNLADGHHTPHFDFDEGVLVRGVSLLSAVATTLLSNAG